MARTLITTNSDLWVNKLLSSHEVTQMGLTSSDFYGWNLDGSASFDGTEWNNGAALTEVGSLGTTINHFGDTRYCDLDGSADYLIHNGTTFDHTGSFTIGAWFEHDGYGAERCLFSKGDGTTANNAFHLRLSGGGNNLTCAIHYNASSSDGFAVPHIGQQLAVDNQYHHFVMIVDQTNTSVTLMVDGKIVGHDVNSNYATLNSSTAKLAFGVKDEGSPSLYWKGGISDAFYYKGAMTYDQCRRLYASGKQKKAHYNGTKLILSNEAWDQRRVGLISSVTGTGYLNMDISGLQVGQKYKALYHFDRVPTATSQEMYAYVSITQTLATLWSGQLDLRLSGGTTSWYSAGTTFYDDIPFTFISDGTPVRTNIPTYITSCRINAEGGTSGTYAYIESLD